MPGDSQPTIADTFSIAKRKDIHLKRNEALRRKRSSTRKDEDRSDSSPVCKTRKSDHNTSDIGHKDLLPSDSVSKAPHSSSVDNTKSALVAARMSELVALTLASSLFKRLEQNDSSAQRQSSTTSNALGEQLTNSKWTRIHVSAWTSVEVEQWYRDRVNFPNPIKDLFLQKIQNGNSLLQMIPMTESHSKKRCKFMGTSTSFSKRYPSEEKMSDISYAPSITNLSNTKVKVTPADVGILTSLQQLRLREEIILLQRVSSHSENVERVYSNVMLRHDWITDEWLPNYVGLAQYANLFSSHHINTLSLLSLNRTHFERQLDISDAQHIDVLLNSIEALRSVNMDLTKFTGNECSNIPYMKCEQLFSFLTQSGTMNLKNDWYKYMGINGAYLANVTPGREDKVVQLIQNRVTDSDAITIHVPLLRLSLTSIITASGKQQRQERISIKSTPFDRLRRSKTAYHASAVA